MTEENHEQTPPSDSNEGSVNKNVRCPQCGSDRTLKYGVRKTVHGEVQRYFCKNCALRFSDPSRPKLPRKIPSVVLNSLGIIVSRRQVCDLLTEESKNLATVEPEKLAQREGTILSGEVKGKILEYSFSLLKKGYSKYTINGRTKLLKRLAKLGNLLDPESIKEVIAKQEWSGGRKENAVNAYTGFLQMQNAKWDPPQYRRIRRLPFIPTESEVDQLIGGCNKRMATFLQLLKETGARCGEACQLKWIDIDVENSSVRVTPEKGSNPRMFRISNKLMSMLNMVPKDMQTVFVPNANVLRKSFQIQRKKIAFKLQNPRLSQISFHTLRHFKATMEYHKTKDILHVMQVLGHKNINNTLIYTQLINFKDDDYIAKVAHSEQEVCQLLEAGFEYVCDYDRDKILRKRK